MAASLKYRRVLLKLSGEALMGAQAYGIDVSTGERIASDVKAAGVSGPRPGAQNSVHIRGRNSSSA